MFIKPVHGSLAIVRVHRVRSAVQIVRFCSGDALRTGIDAIATAVDTCRLSTCMD